MSKQELIDRIYEKIVSKLRQQQPQLVQQAINADLDNQGILGMLPEILQLLDEDSLYRFLGVLDSDFMRVQLDKRFRGRQYIGTATSIAELEEVLNSIAQEYFYLDQIDVGLFDLLLVYLDTDTMLEWASILDNAELSVPQEERLQGLPEFEEPDEPYNNNGQGSMEIY